MNRNAKRVMKIILIATLCAVSLLALGGCSLYILTSVKVHDTVVDGVHFRVDTEYKTATAFRFDADRTLQEGELQVCEVPSTVTYRFKQYTVTSIQDVSGVDTIIKGNAQIGELIVPATVSYIQLRYYKDIDSLQKITVKQGNSRYFSKDGVLFKNDYDYNSRDGINLDYYPQGKQDATFEFPAKTRNIDDYSQIWKNVYLQNLDIEEGSARYKSVNGALYSIDGETLLIYPVNRIDATFVAPKGMKNIDSRSLFWDNDNVAIVQVEQDSLYLSVENNVLYSKDGSELIFRPNFGSKAFAIPSTVKVVSYNALKGVQYLYVPQSVVVFLDAFTTSRYSITKINHIYFESNSLPKYLRDEVFTVWQLNFGYTRQEFDNLVGKI